MNDMIAVQNLRKVFKLSKKQQKIANTKEAEITAVDGISFSVGRGEVFGLLGPNGAGKTTTLRMLATLIRPDSGDAVLAGAGIVREPEKVREQIGFLTSELKLEDFFTPNYLYDFFSELHQVEPAVSRQRKKELFERFGIDRYAEVKVGDLSTGMRQKVSLVIALVHDPSVIIFDEPTNGLDVLTARVVTDFLIELKKQGRTILVSSHIFSLIDKICDRVGVLIDGRMAACGTLEAVKDGMSLEDRFFALYDASQKGGESL